MIKGTQPPNKAYEVGAGTARQNPNPRPSDLHLALERSWGVVTTCSGSPWQLLLTNHASRLFLLFIYFLLEITNPGEHRRPTRQRSYVGPTSATPSGFREPYGVEAERPLPLRPDRQNFFLHYATAVPKEPAAHVTVPELRQSYYDQNALRVSRPVAPDDCGCFSNFAHQCEIMRLSLGPI